MAASDLPPQNSQKNCSLLTKLIFVMIAIIYSLSLMTRRFHYINRSGWWSIAGLIPLLNVIAGLILLFKKGTVGDNKYGEDPLAR